MDRVIFRPPRSRREDAPRLVDLAHVGRRLLVGVEVGMEPLGEAPMGAGHLLLAGIAGDPEDGVGVAKRVVWHCRGF
jgi:hypothetical protein